MDTFLILLLFVAISFLDYRRMIKKKDKKNLIIYSLILGFAFIITELHILGFRVIGLNQIVTFIIDMF